jgi:type I restriction enzyme S subunit
LGQGSTFEAINREDLEELQIPLPVESEQRRIATLLRHVDRLRRTRHYACELSDTFLLACFEKLFGDPIVNPNCYPQERLEDLIEPDRPITYGILKPGDDVPGGVPYVRVTDIQGGQVLPANVRRTTPEIDAAYRRSTLRLGDLLLTIRGHVGRLGIVPASLDGANITQDTARLAPRKSVDVYYLMGCLAAEGMQELMTKHTRGAAVQGINLGDVKELPIPVPPKAVQQRYIQVVSIYQRLRANQREALRQADHLFRSLLVQAFA